MKVKQLIEDDKGSRSPFEYRATPAEAETIKPPVKKKETAITPEQIELAYNKLGEANRSFNTALSIEEINDLAQELYGTGRSPASWVFLLTRLHVLVFGMAPHGVSESRAEKMFGYPSKEMVRFAQGEGIDVEGQISAAREELRNRPVRIKRDVALKLMADYYMANKATLPKSVTQYREEIIGRLMAGMNPEQAFDVA